MAQKHEPESKMLPRKFFRLHLKNSLKRHETNDSVSPEVLFSQHDENSLAWHSSNKQNRNWPQVVQQSSYFANQTNVSLQSHQSEMPAINSFRGKDDHRKNIHLPCIKVQAGKMAICDNKVTFAQEKLTFLCPSYSLDQLFLFNIDHSDLVLVEYYFGDTLNVVLISLTSHMQKEASEHLKIQNQDDLKQLIFIVKKEEILKLQGVIKKFPIMKMKNITYGDAQKRIQNLITEVKVTSDKIRELFKISTLKQIGTPMSSDKELGGWKDPYPQGLKDVTRMGRSEEYLKPQRKPRNVKQIKKSPVKQPKRSSKQTSVVSRTLSFGEKITAPLRGFSDRAEVPRRLSSEISTDAGESDTVQVKKEKLHEYSPENSDDDFVAFSKSRSVKRDKTSEYSSKKLVSSSPNNKSDNNYYVVYPPPPDKHGMVILQRDIKCLQPREWLNDTIIDFWFRYALNYTYNTMCSVEEKQGTHIFSSFFCTILNQVSNEDDSLTSLSDDKENKYQRTSRWTRNIDIFEKDFLVLPVNHQQHWFLVIVCFLGQTAKVPLVGEEELFLSDSDEAEKVKIQEEQSSSPLSKDMLRKRPCILVFDSLFGKVPGTIDHLRNFFELEYKHRRGSRLLFNEESLPVIHPRVPQQDNSHDCGVFVVQFFETFCQTLLKSFEVPMESFTDWFSVHLVKEKRLKIKNLLETMHQDQETKGQLEPNPQGILGPYEHVFQP